MQVLKMDDPESFVVMFDSRPTILPRWPCRPCFRTVVLEYSAEDEPVAAMIETDADLDSLLIPGRFRQQLFFELPETAVNRYL